MTAHPTWRELVHAVFDCDSSATDVDDHCSHCASCESRRRSIVRLRDALLLSGAPAPSPAWIESAWRRLAEETERPQRSASRPNAIVTFIATLLADSLEPSPALRGTMEADRVRLYEAGAHMISLGVEPSEDGTFTVRGQLMTQETTSTSERNTVTVRVGADSREATLSTEGEFTVLGVPPGDMELTLRVGDVVIQLRP